MDNNKPTLLTWHDFMAPTGFANVAKNLLKGTQEDYNVEVVGINYRKPKKFDTDKYFVYPTPNPNDQLGQQVMKERLTEGESPELIFLFQDMNHIAPMAKKIKEEWSPESKIVSYFPIDGYPVSKTWGGTLEYSDIVITYTDWAIRSIQDFYPDNDKTLHKLYHGVERDTFYDMEQDQIDAMRAHAGWHYKFVILNLNRFQPRKQIPATLRSYSMFAQGWKECLECNHHMPLNMGQCELCMSRNLREDTSQAKGDVYLYLHMMMKSQAMGNTPADVLPSHLENAGFDINKKETNEILGLNGKDINAGEVPESQVNEIYNCVNLNMTTAVGEGCGLSLLESASCGVPSVAPKNSAIPEMLGDTGYLVPNKAVFNMNHDSGHMRPIVDEWAMVQALEKAYKKWKDNGKGKQVDSKLVERIKKEFSWQDKREKLHSLFKQALSI